MCFEVWHYWLFIQYTSHLEGIWLIPFQNHFLPPDHLSSPTAHSDNNLKFLAVSRLSCCDPSCESELSSASKSYDETVCLGLELNFICFQIQSWAWITWIQVLIVLIGKSEHPSCETLFLGCDLSKVSNFADFVFYIVTSATVPAPWPNAYPRYLPQTI